MDGKTNLVIGRQYHVKWANKDCVWSLFSFNESTGVAILTTKRGKKITAKISDIYDINKNLQIQL